MWNEYIKNVCKAGNQALGFWEEILKSRFQEGEEAAYKALVRPRVEYACSVWDPHTQDNIKALRRSNDAQPYGLPGFVEPQAPTTCWSNWTGICYRAGERKLDTGSSPSTETNRSPSTLLLLPRNDQLQDHWEVHTLASTHLKPTELTTDSGPSFLALWESGMRNLKG